MSSLFFFNLRNANGIPSFANHIFRLLVGAQSQEERLPKLVIMGPLGTLDLGNQHWVKPVAAFHDRWRNP
jgi:hypothetical protein